MRFFAKIHQSESHLCTVTSEDGKHHFTLVDFDPDRRVMLLIGLEKDTPLHLLDDLQQAKVYMEATCTFRPKKRSSQRRCYINRKLAEEVLSQPAQLQLAM